MFGLGPTELIIIIVVALVIFGPSRLPKVGQAAGDAFRQYKGMREEINGTKKQVQLKLEDVILGPPIEEDEPKS